MCAFIFKIDFFCRITYNGIVLSIFCICSLFTFFLFPHWAYFKIPCYCFRYDSLLYCFSSCCSVYSIQLYYSLPSSHIMPLHMRDKNSISVYFDFSPPSLCTLVIHFSSTYIIKYPIHFNQFYFKHLTISYIS